MYIFELQSTSWHMLRTRTQLNLRIRAVRSESAFSALGHFASLAIQNASSEESAEAAWMRRLIWIFAGRICLKVRFLTLRLVCIFVWKWLHWCCFISFLKGNGYAFRRDNSIRLFAFFRKGICPKDEIATNYFLLRLTPLTRRFVWGKTSRKLQNLSSLSKNDGKTTKCIQSP